MRPEKGVRNKQKRNNERERRGVKQKDSTKSSPTEPGPRSEERTRCVPEPPNVGPAPCDISCFEGNGAYGTKRAKRVIVLDELDEQSGGDINEIAHPHAYL